DANAGAAYVYHGGTILPPGYQARFDLGAAGYHIGWKVTGAGDMNGDGYDDVAVGAPDGSVVINFVYIWKGSASGMNGTKEYSSAYHTGYAQVLVGVGDYDGDGYDDLAVGKYLDGDDAGGIFVYRGSSGLGSRTSAVANGADGDLLGSALGAGDFNGDGYNDLLAGSPGVDGSALDLGQAQIFDGYYDRDGDGVIEGVDCDDGDRNVRAATAWYRDVDGDLYGDIAVVTYACDQPSGYVADHTDCDDDDRTANPGEVEQCDPNDVDEDCDGFADEADPEGTLGLLDWHPDVDVDTYGDGSVTVTQCDAPSGYVADASDCNDGDPLIQPGSAETCDPDNVDENCNGVADDADTNPVGRTTWYRDADGDGYAVTGPPITTQACDQPVGYVQFQWPADCNDAVRAINPGATEVCDPNNVDEDCSGDADDDDWFATGQTVWYADVDRDGFGDPDVSDWSCDPRGTFDATTGDDCDDTRDWVHPGGIEVCDAEDLDEDCNTVADDADSGATGLLTWYRDVDGDLYGVTADTVAQCEQPPGYVAAPDDCDDGDPLRSPGLPEVCDADDRDEDCDGLSDDADPSATGQTPWYVDRDRDGLGADVPERMACDARALEVADAGDCDDGRSLVHTGAVEQCDGRDDDCDGVVDDGAPDSDSDGTCDALDACPGDPADDADGDGVCDDVDPCFGDNTYGDRDGDGVCDGAPFQLDATTLARATPVTFTVTGGRANATLYLLASITGDATPTCYGTSTLLCTDLERPMVVAVRTTDATGAATVTVTVPRSIPHGTAVWFQAVWRRGQQADRSNVLADTVRTVVAAIAPGAPHTTDDLELTVTGSLVTSVTAYGWKRDGAVVPSLHDATVPASATAAGEVWQGVAQVVADGQQRLVSTTPVAIAGTAPQVADVAVVATGTTSPCAVLTCEADVSDADGDAVTLSYRWQVDGVWVDATDATLSGVSLAVGDAVACEVTASTADGDASALSSSYVVDTSTADEDGDGTCIEASGCLVGAQVLAVVRVGDQLECRPVTWTEGCADGADLSATWTVDGVVQTETGTTFDTSVLTGGEEVTCALYGPLASGYPAHDVVADGSATVGASTWTLFGEAATDWAGRSVAVFDDFDGDGFAEVGIGAPNAAPEGMTSAGRLYVVYGRADGADVQLSDVAAGTGGWAWDGQSGGWDAYATICSDASSLASQITCAAQRAGRTLDAAFEAPIGDGLGTQVRSADVDGDGVEDIVVSAPYAATLQYLAGRTYVISGVTAEGTALTDAVEGTTGFVVDGRQGVFPLDYAAGIVNQTYHLYDGDLAGMGLDVGDVNGDGLADLLIGAPNVDTLGENSGLTYVVPGSTAPSAVQLLTASADDGVSTIAGTGNDIFWSHFGGTVRVVGDVDGDGDDELVIQPEFVHAGGGYLVDGDPEAEDLVGSDDGPRVASFPNESFSYSHNGDTQDDTWEGLILGTGANGVGDLDGDGRAEFAYVLMRPDPTDDGRLLSDVRVYPSGYAGTYDGGSDLAAEGGFQVVSDVPQALYTPLAVWALGDVDGDGYDDLGISALGNLYVPARLYVMYGSTARATVHLSDLAAGIGGFAIDMADDIDEVAHGDVDGDGVDDVVIGSGYADGGAGRAMVWFGRDQRSALDQIGTAADDVLTGTAGDDALAGGRGDDVVDGGVGGADALSGGSGDDTLVVGSAAFLRVRGGRGDDTLALDGVPSLDLTSVRGRVAQIERIDLRSAAVLTLATTDVLRATDGRNTLEVTGVAGSRVEVAQDAWHFEGLVTTANGDANQIRAGNAVLLLSTALDTEIPPVLETAGLDVDEVAPAGTVVGEVVATDPDGTVVSIDADLAAAGLDDTLAWDDVTWTLTVIDGAGLDFEHDATLDIPLTLTDDDGLVLSTTLVVTLHDVPEAPTFSVSSSYASVAEGAVAGTFVAAVVAYDQDAGDAITYSISAGDDHGAFAMDPTSGHLTVADGTWLDYETQPVLDLTVRATDTTGLFSERALQVDLTDADNLTAAFTVPFLSEGQSLTRQGDSGPLSDVLVNVSHVHSWDTTNGDGDTVIHLPGLPSVLPAIHSTGELELYINGEVDAGSLNAWLPAEVTMTLPDQIPLGTAFDIDWSWELQPDAAIWGQTASSDLTASMALRDFSLDIDLGSLGHKAGSVVDQLVGPYDVVVEAEPFAGAPLDVLFDPSTRPETYSPELQAYIAGIASQFASALYDRDFSYEDYSDENATAEELANPGDLVLAWWNDVTGTHALDDPQEFLYALLYLKDGPAIFEDGFDDRHVLAAASDTHQLFEVDIDPASLLRDVMPLVAGGRLTGGYLYWDFEFTGGHAKSLFLYPAYSTVTLRLVSTETYLVEAERLTADIVFENGTRYDDVDLSEPLTGIVLATDEDANGDGKVDMDITYRMEASVARYGNKHYEVEWTTRAVDMSVQVYRYHYDQFGLVSGQSLVNSSSFGPLYNNYWTFKSPQPSWTWWSLGGVSHPEMNARVQIVQ
ncbi:MAG: FG-GAP repeat protein, partial [Alphaproteobacteria bacterium]|nr:FG-GAP repeat protein [Alphaproteobacteria bacterium]